MTPYGRIDALGDCTIVQVDTGLQQEVGIALTSQLQLTSEEPDDLHAIALTGAPVRRWRDRPPLLDVAEPS